MKWVYVQEDQPIQVDDVDQNESNMVFLDNDGKENTPRFEELNRIYANDLTDGFP